MPRQVGVILAALPALAALILFLAPAAAQPLIRRSGPPAQDGWRLLDWLPAPVADLVGTVATWQIALGRLVNDELSGLEQRGGWAALATLVAIGLAYGVLHAAGPGHGKAVIGAFVIGRRTGLRRATLAAYTIAATQAVTAIVIVAVLVLALGSTGASAERQSLWLEVFSYAAIALMGAWMLVNVVRGRDPCCHEPAHRGAHRHGHDMYGHDEHGDDEHDHRDHRLDDHHAGDHDRGAAADRNRGLTSLSILAGLRPCTGALLILLFTAANGMFAFGVAAVVAMGVGVGSTVAVLAVGARGVRALIDRLAPAGGGSRGAMTQRIVGAAAAGLILAVGGFAFLASLSRLPA